MRAARTQPRGIFDYVVFAIVLGLVFLFRGQISTIVHNAMASPVVAPTSVVDKATYSDALAKLQIIPSKTRVTVPGYQRGCAKGQACSFGPAWTDDTTAPGGHDGCDTRNQVLASSMTNVSKGTSACVVQSGTLNDPYTAQTIQFTKANAALVQIDHVIPLAYAYDMGAASWSQDRRNAFANDLSLNLVAVSGPANEAKSDKGPSQYMPPNPAYTCAYAARWVQVATVYTLALATADKATLESVLTRCVKG